MVDGARDRMVDSAVKLLAMQGFSGASFSSVLDDAKAPRGSIYHHFPGGKEELVLAAVDRSGRNAASVVERLHGLPVEQIVTSFVGVWRAILRASDFGAGCSVLGATVSGSDDEVVARAADVFRAWEERLAAAIEAAGFPHADAEDFGSLLISACEGAVVLCRAERSFVPLDRAERALLRAATAR